MCQGEWWLPKVQSYVWRKANVPCLNSYHQFKIKTSGFRVLLTVSLAQLPCKDKREIQEKRRVENTPKFKFSCSAYSQHLHLFHSISLGSIALSTTSLAFTSAHEQVCSSVHLCWVMYHEKMPNKRVKVLQDCT